MRSTCFCGGRGRWRPVKILEHLLHLDISSSLKLVHGTRIVCRFGSGLMLRFHFVPLVGFCRVLEANRHSVLRAYLEI